MHNRIPRIVKSNCFPIDQEKNSSYSTSESWFLLFREITRATRMNIIHPKTDSVFSGTPSFFKSRQTGMLIMIEAASTNNKSCIRLPIQSLKLCDKAPFQVLSSWITFLNAARMRTSGNSNTAVRKFIAILICEIKRQLIRSVPLNKCQQNHLILKDISFELINQIQPWQ